MSGYSRVFAPGQLTLGFILPLEGYPDGPAPTMKDHAVVTRLADELGFGALWARDVPTYDPHFGDVGQVFDPFTYLGFLSANTNQIALGTGSAVMTLRHPLLLAKQAASIDRLSNGRLLLGVASGDRAVAYPAFGTGNDFESRGERFREAFAMFRASTEEDFPVGLFPRFGELGGRVDTIPKPIVRKIPTFVTGRSRQDVEWIATHSDGWFFYNVGLERVDMITQTWFDAVRRTCGEDTFKPFFEGLFLELEEDPDFPLTPIPAGLRVGRHGLLHYLEVLKKVGVNHTAFNPKPSRRPFTEILHELAEYVLPRFPSLT
ncbi:luciferase [Paraburkholderia phytofirmans OLGA172]|uniref:Luciferase n=1 Tax=Paraburkholderia phytofirmans OLGA172 TaxID=1417228 RepID=A0A167WM22_9BURK|nr:luciferase [Paraburkholderia phytofirmans OLGA172]